MLDVEMASKSKDCLNNKDENFSNNASHGNIKFLTKCKDMYVSLEAVIIDGDIGKILCKDKSKSTGHIDNRPCKDAKVFKPFICKSIRNLAKDHNSQRLSLLKDSSQTSVDDVLVPRTVFTETCPVLITNQSQDYYISSRETSQTSDSVICRICHSAGDDKLIAPCKCDGSTRYVHANCLVTWFKRCVKNECELCQSEVKIRKINHRLSLWRKPEDRPIPLIWFTVFFIGLFLNILSIYVNASEYCKSTACLIFYVVNGFGIILDAAFLWFWFLKCRQYWKKWCALNQDWYIDIDEEEAMRETTPMQVEYVKDQPNEAQVYI